MNLSLVTATLLITLAVIVSGCSTQSVSDQMERPTATQAPEGETQLLPVKQVDEMVNASAGAVIDTTMKDIDTLTKDLQSETFTDLPNDLGQ